MIKGIGAFALVAGWLGYLYRKLLDPQSTSCSATSSTTYGEPASWSLRVRSFSCLLLLHMSTDATERRLHKRVDKNEATPALECRFGAEPTSSALEP